MKTNTLMLFLFVLCLRAYSQQKVQEGSLLRINFYQNTIDTTNKVEHWQSVTTSTGYTEESFENVFTENNRQYFIKKISYSGSYLPYGPPPSFQTKLIRVTQNNELPIFGAYYPECGTGVYLSDKTRILQSNSGFIMTNNLNAAGYLMTSDSLYSLNDKANLLRAIQIVGKINDDFLLTIHDFNYGSIYGLINFDERHNLIIKKKVHFPGMESPFSIAPLKCCMLDDSLFIISFDWSNKLYIDRLNDTTFVKVDSVIFSSQPGFWTVQNNYLYYLEGQNLVRRHFDKNNLSFDAIEIILPIGANNGTDVNCKFFSTTNNDSLYIYSLKQNKLVNKFHYSASDRYFRILVDSPYVYIPVIDKATDVNFPKSIENNFHLSQNYPNPFNLTTIIRFSIPVETRHASSLQHVTLKVYDMLGREVAMLVNEEKSSGNYEVKFDGSNLSSGIYFYRMQAGSFNQTKKMVLIK